MLTKDKYRLGQYLFWLVLLLALVRLSLDAGISGDEYVHLEHSYKVLDYYHSLGKDLSALNTPRTNLKYYGQSFENGVTLISQIFNIDDIFTLRHVANAIVAWLILVFTFLLTKTLSNRYAAYLGVFLLLISPRFIGHSFNNLKDIPFALGYLASLYFTIRYLKNLKSTDFKLKTGLVLAMAFTFAIRPSGLLMICYLWLFAGWIILRTHGWDLKVMWPEIKSLLILSASAYFIGILFWPYALENPFWHPIKSHLVMTDYLVRIRQLFEGQLQWSDQLPWYYLLKYLLISVPVLVLVGVSTYLMLPFLKQWRSKVSLSMGLLAFSIGFPLLFIVLQKANVYGGWRHILFIYPPLVVAAALGFTTIIKTYQNKIIHLTFALMTIILAILPISFMLRNHPYQYVYFNELAGGVKKAFGNYELDYYYHSSREASEWLQKYLLETRETDLILGSNFETRWDFRDFEAVSEHQYFPYYERERYDWDYAILTAAYLFHQTIRDKQWPPKGTLHTINVDDIPICAVVKRPSKNVVRALSAIDKNQIDLAIQLLKDELEGNPENISAYMELGKIRLQQKNNILAKQHFENCLLKAPYYEPANYYLAHVHWEMGKQHVAIAELEDLLKVNPKYLLAYISLAEFHQQLKNAEKARDYLNRCLQIKPNYDLALNKLNEINLNNNH
jgi:tetratricopeptide (TPR) repeat protein